MANIAIRPKGILSKTRIPLVVASESGFRLNQNRNVLGLGQLDAVSSTTEKSANTISGVHVAENQSVFNSRGRA